ncbi:helicase C-terminal domain-containing protein [Lactobacillus psittaci]|uniref:3'-5' exonuclease DinG n=1 Tax=Lactobacillus psittaci DSM 15354 TaxID=1122152 RepID=A0A0R1S543_9LACO|nr:helicase C-terminal domain-containing protein [Lactobacillus psittaci]KRL63630.1 ATP-dependent DNA helicase [Lactobacillus psittaci DSM 15354]
MAAFADQVFAVVDLETTGTKRGQDHIIQFGCAIIKNLKITKTYSFLINPKTQIPLPVQNLTRINNEMVDNQPEFKEFANQIEDILKDTIFVAHNINFDLPFLNNELVANGFKPLKNRAIDTVELAKITFPTLPSYRLTDLTNSLKLEHTNPHKADSDAYATASLLLKIFNKLEQLPQSTLNNLTALSKSLLRDTQFVFKEIADVARQEKRPLGKEYLQVRTLVLRKQNKLLTNKNYQDLVFPETNNAKKELFKDKIAYRVGQVDLINHLHQFFKSNKRALIAEAPGGTGKSFAYLFSSLYELFAGRKLVIATPTTILQEQLIQQEIPQAMKVSGLDLPYQVVKSSRHYLDLDGFYHSLMQKTDNQETLNLKMGILIWLTETETGDLDELKTTNFAAPYFDQIQHPGDARVGTEFAEYDFWNLARFRQEQAEILVTNQAYLANHYQDSIWGQNPYLIIDEAHRFSDIVMNSYNNSLQFESFWGMLSHLRNMLLYAEDNFYSHYKEDSQIKDLIDKADPEITEMVHSINAIQTYLYEQRHHALSKKLLANNKLEIALTKDAINNRKTFLELLSGMQVQIEKVRNIINQIIDALYQRVDSFLPKEEAQLNELNEQIDELDFYSEQAYILSDLVTDQTQFENIGLVLIITDPTDPLSTNLNWLLLNPATQLSKIYAVFNKIVFISATLATNGDFTFSKNNLNLNQITCSEYCSNYNFNLPKQIQAYALKDAKEPEFLAESAYQENLPLFLLKAIKVQNKVLILFTNLDAISDVYSAIVNRPEFKDFEILAQGITGSNERIAKRFTVATQAIILGANSFWEGVDFGKTKIDLVIATKLPFESPDQLEVKLRQTRLQNMGVDIFKADALPRAIIRLKQGLGRLIRGENDCGIFVLLDQRIWSSSYGQEFINALPVKLEQKNRAELIEKIKRGYER